MILFGIPMTALLGQLLLGLVNGSFYAILSLGLAVIFGLLNVINFAHGALFMLGAVLAWAGLNYFDLSFWVMLLVAPLLVGLVGIVIERLFLRWIYRLDHLYGLLLTLGITLILEGVLRSIYGVSGLAYSAPISGATNLGFMIMPNYRGFVVVASILTCLATWFVIEKTKLGAYLRAGTENPRLVEAFGVNVPLMITLTYGFGVALAGFGRRAGRTRDAGLAADGAEPHHHRVRGGGDRWHGLDHGHHRDRAGAGDRRRGDQGVLPRGVFDRGFRDHGRRAVDPSGRPVRPREVMLLSPRMLA